jgi:hypothetical protein
MSCAVTIVARFRGWRLIEIPGLVDEFFSSIERGGVDVARRNTFVEAVNRSLSFNP